MYELERGSGVAGTLPPLIVKLLVLAIAIHSKNYFRFIPLLSNIGDRFIATS